MAEITLTEVACQFDDLYDEIENINSLAYALMLASSAGIDANILTGALYLLNNATQNTRCGMNKLNKELRQYQNIPKEKLKAEN